MSPTSRPTLQTIADVVGVSRTTVSNAYNRPGELTEALRKRILETADELGYPGPDPAARRLRGGSSHTIGVVFAESVADALNDPTAVALMRGIADACESTELALSLLPALAGASGTRVLRDADVDGFIVYSVPEGNAAVDAVAARRLPVVAVDEPHFEMPTAGHVRIDDRAAARSAAEHLLQLGHRDIVVLTRPLAPGASGVLDAGRATARVESRVLADRLQGYADAFEAAALAWSDVRIHAATASTPAAARTAAATILAGPTRPTAILAATDQLALAVLHEAAHRSITVPTELSVVGFDDVPRAEVSAPALTTVRQPLFEKGRLALRMLKDDALGTVTLPTELVVRASTASPPT